MGNLLYQVHEGSARNILGGSLMIPVESGCYSPNLGVQILNASESLLLPQGCPECTYASLKSNPRQF